MIAAQVRRVIGPALRGVSPGLRRWRAKRPSRNGEPVVADYPELAAVIADRYGSDDGAMAVRVEEGVNDAVIAVVEQGKRSEVIKVALTTNAADEFDSQDRVIRELTEQGCLGDWRELIPTSEMLIPGPSGANSGAIVESRMPGINLRQAILDGRLSSAAAATLALDAISPFHRAMGEMVTIDESHVADWVEGPLAVVGALFDVEHRPTSQSAQALVALRRALDDGLIGRRVWVGWVHGDYTAGNVLVDGHPAHVSGVVDWGRGTDGLPCVLDDVLLLMSLWCEARDVDFGVFVEQRLRHDDGRLGSILADRASVHGGSDRAASRLPDDRTLYLLTWLRHVSDNLEKSARYRRSAAWIANNVDPVLDHFGQVAEERTQADVESVPLDGSTRGWRDRLPLVSLAAAVVLWGSSLPRINLHAMGDFGLVSVLPLTFWAGLVLLTVTYAVTVAEDRPDHWRNAAYLVALVVVLHATPSILYGTLRYSWAWKHIGIVEFISRTHHVDPSVGQLSAYQDWPGFFTMNAVATNSAGFRSALSYASWAPLVFNLLDLGPLMLILRSLTKDRRLRWWAMWIFCLANWVGQDYFSPQAFNYFLYLCVLAVCLRWLRRDHPSPAGALAGTDPDALARRAMVAFSMLALATMATSHQLTPFMMLAALGGLWVFHVARTRTLFAFGAVVTVGWLVVSGSEFLSTNYYWIIESIGRPFGNTGDTFINLANASRGQATVALIDRALSVGVWGLAAVGVWRRGRPLAADRAAVVLMLTPIPLLVANSYGGEMLFRVYLFALPFASFFAAAALLPRVAAGRGRLAQVGRLVVALALVAGFVVAYYGKEQMNYFTPGEVQASEFVYAKAPVGSLIIGATSNLPWAFRNYEQYDYEWFALESAASRRATERDAAAQLSQFAATAHVDHAFVILTSSQAAEIDATGVMPRGSIGRITKQLDRSTRFVPVFRGPDAVVYRWDS